MRTSLVIRLLGVVCMSAAFVKSSCACQCGIGAHGMSAWENAKEFSHNSGVIFEGTPVRFELKWSVLTARDGELIPADLYPRDSSTWASMVVTFQVRRAYRGVLGPEMQLHTGLGGGDCAAIYATGVNYLVYASDSGPGELGVSMCSPGGWIGDDRVATDLRYLRKEPPIASDLARILHWTEPGSEGQKEQYLRAAEEGRKRYAAATGRICGTLIRSDRNTESRGAIAFLSPQGYYPVASPDASIGENGSFCSPNLGPGKYYLYYVGGSDRGAAALYYPGVNDVAKAATIAVTAGQTVSNIVFTAGAQSAYSVRGFVSADAWNDFSSNVDIKDVMVLLIRSDGDRRVWYSEKATFLLPKLGYFKFENVVPGRYAAYVLAPGPGWMTRKADVSVTSHMKFISLDLVRKR
jgi:hypothetical protein